MKGALGLVVLLGLVIVAVLVYSRRAGGGDEPAPEPAPPPIESEVHSGVREGVAPATPMSFTLLSGRVVDVDGLPFADLPIAATAPHDSAVALTDAHGMFEFPDCPVGPILLELTASFDPDEPLGQRKLAAVVAPLEIVVPAGERHDTGTHVVPRSRPCGFEGWVEIDPQWSLEKSTGLQHALVELEVPRADELVGLAVAPPPQPGAPLDWRVPPWRTSVPETPRVETDGTFRFVVETPHDPILVRVRLRRFEPVEQLIVPTADGFLTHAFTFP